MDVQLFEAVSAGPRSALLRVEVSGSPARLASNVVVQAPGRAEQLPALPGSEIVEDGVWRAAYPIQPDLLESARRFTLLVGDGTAITLPAPTRRAPRPAAPPAPPKPDPDVERLRRERDAIIKTLHEERARLEALEQEFEAQRADSDERV